MILAFTSLIPLGFGFAIGNIPLGAELASYFPDGSPYVAYTADTQENFVALDTPGYLVLRDVKWEDASAQTAVDSLLAALESDDFVIAPYSTSNWLAAYRAVAADRGATASAAPPLRQSGDGFLADVAAFLKETDPQCVDRQLGGECLREIIPARHSKEVVWAGEAGASPITATRFSCTLAVPDEVKGRVELMNEHRATADANRGSIDAVVWSYFMLFSDRDRVRSTGGVERIGRRNDNPLAPPLRLRSWCGSSSRPSPLQQRLCLAPSSSSFTPFPSRSLPSPSQASTAVSFCSCTSGRCPWTR